MGKVFESWALAPGGTIVRKTAKSRRTAYRNVLESEIDSLKRRISELEQAPKTVKQKEFGKIKPSQTLQILEEIKVPPIDVIQEEKKKKKPEEGESKQ